MESFIFLVKSSLPSTEPSQLLYTKLIVAFAIVGMLVLLRSLDQLADRRKGFKAD